MRDESKTKRRLIAELGLLRQRVATLEAVHVTGIEGGAAEIGFGDLFDLDEIQQIQDAFAKATGVASVITDPHGRPLTEPSNSCRLCRDVIRRTEKGLANCIRSDVALGKPNPDGPTVQPCLSCGLWDGGASISVGSRHIANWLVGQVRDEQQDERAMVEYARDIGADESEFIEALAEVTVMPNEQFEQVCWALFRLANQLSEKAYQNLQLAQMVHQREQVEGELRKARDQMEQRVRLRTAELQRANQSLQAEIAERKRVEEELRQHRDHLGELVAERTADLRKTNEELEQEIADRKVAEAERTRLIAILESTSDLVGTITPEGRITYMNRAGMALLGWSDDEDISGKMMSEYHPRDAAQTMVNEALPAAASDRVWIGETVLLRADGAEIPASQVIMAHKDQNGQVEYFSTIIRDITELKQAEEALQLDESRLETLLALNQKTESSLEELTDFSLEEAIRLTKSSIVYLAFMSEDETALTVPSRSKSAMQESEVGNKRLVHPVETTALWGEAVRQRKPVITNDCQGIEPLKKVYPQGNVHVLRHMDIPVFDGGRIVVVAGVGNRQSDYDLADVRQLTLLMEGMWRIIQRRRVEQQREELLADLEAQNAELERFTYTVSHDLKSPLITIKGYLGLLRDDLADESPEAVEDDIARMVGAADKMGELLGELLELSRIGRLSNQLEDIPLGDLASEAVELVQGQINQKGVEVEISPDLPVVRGDRLRLLEVMQNLIDNAVKYMGQQPHPKVAVGSRTCDTGPICYVRDNGMGIDPRYHGKVFGLFDQLDPRVHGSGIGLALAKRIVEVHGGRIWVESDGLGQGSTFCFSLPLETQTTD